MSSTYSTNLALELIGTGDQAGTWGNTTNTNLGTLIEQAISGYVTQAVSTGTDTTITIPNGATGVARNMYIELTGTGGASTNLIVPANKKLYFIFNNASGAVTVKVSGQTGVSVPAGKKVVLASNGTDTVNALNYIADFGSNSATITQLTATSATITNLTLTSLVISNLSIASANITTLTSSSATISTTLALSAGTANGVLYLNGSKVATSGSALVFTGTNLGIGNNATNARLEVTASTGEVFRADASGGAFRIVADQSDVKLQGTSSVQGWVNGSEGMRLTSTGLGIGTSSPSGFLANKLVIATGGTANEGMTIYSSSNNGSIWFADATTGTGRYAGGLDYSHSDDTLIFYSAAQGNMRLNSSGNLGLGATPSAYGTRGFDIAGFVGLSQNSAGAAVLAFNNFQNGAGNYIYKTTNPAARYDCGLAGTAAHAWYIAASGTADTAISFTQAMTLDASGRLLVGTTSSYLSQFKSVVEGATSGSATLALGLYKGGTPQILNGDVLGNLYFYGIDNDLSAGNDNLGGRIHVEATSDWTSTTTCNAAMVFSTHGNTSGAPSERARITSGGDLLVGTTGSLVSSVSRLRVSATSAPAVDAKTTAAADAVVDEWNSATSGDNTFERFWTEAAPTQRGSIDYNRAGGLVRYNTTSDYRAKDVYGLLENTGSAIDALKVYTGKMKGATQERPMLIAHEAQEVAPYAVSGVKDEENEDGTPKYQQMDHSSLVPLLIAEIQSLRARVAQLESK